MAPSMLASSTPVDVCGALKRAQSSVKAQKTKNASNKNKKRTLLLGANIKLVENDQSLSDGMAVNMSMMLMQHMETIKKSMERGKTRGGRGIIAKTPCKEDRKEEGKEGSPQRDGGSWRQGQGRKEQQ
jgi:hypothetical protein